MPMQLLGQVIETENMKVEYDTLCTNLLQWIEVTIGELSDRNFPNTLTDMQQLMQDFKTYRTVEKPPKLVLLLLRFGEFVSCFLYQIRVR